jgi:hypothetical protein
VDFGPDLFAAVKEDAQEGGLEEERVHAFHGEGLADDAAGGFGEAGPVGAELELHGDAGDDAHGEVDAEDLDPEAGGVFVEGVPGAKGQGLDHENQECQAHRELREEVVVSDGKSEVESM